MRRLRIVIALVTVALALSIGLLVQRVLSSQALERKVQHRAVADRIFDELERALSELLAEEEARPFEHYAFYLEPFDPSRPLEPQRSPLSRPPTAPYVIGYFQLDPDGRLHTPLRPRAGQPKPAGFQLSEAQAARVERIRECVRRSWQEPVGDSLRALGYRQDALAPSDPGGKLAALEKKAADAPAPAAAEAESEPPSSYGLLERLNLGARQRAVRKQKVEYGRSYDASARSEADEASESRFSQSTLEEATATPSRGADLRETASSAPTPQPGDEGGPPAPAERFDDEAAAPVVPTTIVLDPMTGRTTPDGDIVLYRTVVSGQRGYRQGLVIDRTALGTWLERRVIEGSDLLAYADLRFPRPDAPAEPGGSLRYRHRFAEPFQGLAAALRLAPLPASDETLSVWALSGLLAVACGLGLFALYRMVAVALDFAERRNNFVASVSHELKTPLTAIRMYSEMLRDGLVESGEKRDEYYGTIHAESERLSRLVDNVLELSRLEKGQREAVMHVGSVEPLLDEVAETLRPHVEREGFTLRVATEPDLPPVRFDRDAVVQMLFNLVDNALKYAREAERREIRLECRRVAEGVEVSVRDFGPGVGRAHLARILEPFYRGEDELTRTARGTGIGLALVRELAQSMGGTLTCANAEGGGFRVGVALAVSPPPTRG